MSQKYKASVKNLGNSEIEIIGSITWEDFSPRRAEAIEHIGSKMEFDGFRKGKAPENLIIQKVGEMGVLEHMAEHAIMDIYPSIITEHKLDPIGRPEIKITKIGSGSQLEFTITTAIMPGIKLPNYKKIAHDVATKKEYTDNIIITDEEIKSAIIQLRKMRFQQSLVNKSSSLKNEKDSDITIPEISDIKDEDVPELTDEDVKEYGKFENLSDFTEKLKENMRQEKIQRMKEKKRIEIIESIIKETAIETPKILIDYELDRMMAQMEHDITISGNTFDDYMKQIKKTREELRTEFTPDAKKHANLQLIITAISSEEKLKINEIKFKDEMENIKKLYSEHKDFDENRAAVYIKSILQNQAVFEFLEQQ